MSLLPEQVPRSMVHVIVGKSRHGEVAVIVPVLPPDVHSALALCRFLEVLRQQLPLLVEIICRALFVGSRPPSVSPLLSYRPREPGKERGETYHVYQDIQRIPHPALHQLGGVVFRPLDLVVLAEVAAERFPSPVAVDGVGDGREGGNGSVFARVLQELAICACGQLSRRRRLSLSECGREGDRPVPESKPRVRPCCARRY